MITKLNSGGRWHAWIGTDDGTVAEHAVGGYRTEAEAIAAVNAKANPTLVRYVGPLAAYRGAIGWSADGGALIGGRLRLGKVKLPWFRVSRDARLLAQHDTWESACQWLGMLAETNVTAEPDPAGLEVTVGEHVYRLTVC